MNFTEGSASDPFLKSVTLLAEMRRSGWALSWGNFCHRHGFRKNQPFCCYRSGDAATGFRVPTLFPRIRFAETASAPNTYRGWDAPGGAHWASGSPHLENHPYPHAGPIKRAGSWSRTSPSYCGGSGAGQNTETVVVAPPYKGIGARGYVQSSAGDSGYLPMGPWAFKDAVELTLLEAPGW